MPTANRPGRLDRLAAMLLALLLCLGFSGCTAMKQNRVAARHSAPNPVDAATTDLLASINANADRIESCVAQNVRIDGKVEGQPISLDARLAFRQPSEFTLEGRLMVTGKTEVELGANEREIWMYLARANPPTVFHASRSDLAHVQFGIPFHPDWMAEVLGARKLEPALYTPGRPDPSGRYSVLVGSDLTPRGERVRKRVTIENDTRRVVAVELFDPSRKDAQGYPVLITRSKVLAYHDDPSSGAYIPQQVQLDWPQEKASMTIKLHPSDIEINELGDDRARLLFVRREYPGVREMNLAEPIGPMGPAGTVAPTSSAYLADKPAATPPSYSLDPARPAGRDGRAGSGVHRSASIGALHR